VAQREPGDHARREVAIYQEDLIAFFEWEALNEKVEPVRGAVSQDDLLRLTSNERCEGLLEPSGNILECGIRESMWRDLLLDGDLRLLNRDSRKWTLVSAVEPDLIIERPEIALVPHDSSSPNSPDERTLSALLVEPRRVADPHEHPVRTEHPGDRLALGLIL
jgi:hypothetical protein